MVLDGCGHGVSTARFVVPTSVVTTATSVDKIVSVDGQQVVCHLSSETYLVSLFLFSLWSNGLAAGTPLDSSPHFAAQAAAVMYSRIQVLRRRGTGFLHCLVELLLNV